MKKGIIFLSFTLLFLMSGKIYLLYAGLSQPVSIPGKEMLYEYPKGTSVKTLSSDLAQKGIIPSRTAFLWYARLTGKARHLDAGEYLITLGMTPKALLEKIHQGDIYLHTLRVPEGGTIAEVIHAIASNIAVKHTLDFDSHWFMVVSPEYVSGEGLLLPETYFFPKGETDLAIIKRAYHDAMAFSMKAFDARDPSVPYANVYQTLIVASILEKEASIPEEQAKIARVVINRLAKNMPLQMDPTVIYGMGPTFDGKLTKKQLAEPGPYNTYLNLGLPPTPICLPSKGAILAALHPATGDYLYFVSQGDGSHYFSSTLKEHNQAVVKYVIKAQNKVTTP